MVFVLMNYRPLLKGQQQRLSRVRTVILANSVRPIAARRMASDTRE